MTRARPGLAARRKAAGLSQDALAERVRVDRTTVGRWERGESDPQPWHRPKLARALGITGVQLDGLLSTLDDAPSLYAVPSPPLASNGFGDEEEQLRDRLAHAASVDRHALALLTNQANANRELDRALGASAAYPQLIGYLETLDSLRRHTVGSRAALADLYADAAALAGWQALDGGRLSAAWDHHEEAKVAGREGSSPAALVHATAQQAYILLELKEARRALELTNYAIAQARGKVPPLLMSWLYAARGEMCAALTDDGGTHRAFDDAEQSLPDSDWHDPELPYVILNPLHLARWRGNARATLGDAAAIDDLHASLTGLDGSFVRARAGLHVDLAYSLAAAQRESEAKHHLGEAHALAARVGSARQRRRIQRLRSVLRSA